MTTAEEVVLCVLVLLALGAASFVLWLRHYPLPDRFDADWHHKHPTEKPYDND